MPEKYQDVFSDGALTAPPYVKYRVMSEGSFVSWKPGENMVCPGS